MGIEREAFCSQLSRLTVWPALILVVCSFTVGLVVGKAHADPSGPPPEGQVWVESGGQWVAVPAPPSDGPYVWADGRWAPDATPPPVGKEWVPGHWGPGGWVRAHWEVVESPGAGAELVHGHWEGGRWVPGHWRGGPKGRVWTPGRRGPRGAWIPGHWR